MAAAQSAQTPMGLLVAGFNFSGVAEDEFNDWYDTEHVPRLAQVPGVLVARRFRASGGPPLPIGCDWFCVAMHEDEARRLVST